MITLEEDVAMEEYYCNNYCPECGERLDDCSCPIYNSGPELHTEDLDIDEDDIPF